MTTHTTNTVLTASYTLCPPKETTPPQALTSTVSRTFPVAISSDNRNDARVYYSALRKSIAAARENLGEELTAWRDAVGNSESGKERLVKAAHLEEEEGDEGDEGNED
ncbi:hypothetical protein BDN67DRAFT_963322 [Paxillus ammoniavirescens]|nr:hypothetical protein BDN67DRAFT_963322 [Paxillus ammoniavirescens]